MGEITLRRALEDYKTVYMAYRNFAERTRVEYQNDLEDLVEFLEKSRINKVKKLELAHIERYLAVLESLGFAGATRKRKTVTIRSFMTFLYQDRYIESNIAKRLIPPFVDNKTPSFLTEAEYNRLRKACAGYVRDAAIVEFLLQTGIRLSELISLKIDDIDLAGDNGFARIKGGRGREDRMLPLNNKVCKALVAYLSERPDADSSNFFLNKFDQPYGDRGVQKMLRKYLKKAGIERASVHTLRHTFGVQQIAKGINPKTIQDVMGHKDPRSTAIYVSLVRELKYEL